MGDTPPPPFLHSDQYNVSDNVHIQQLDGNILIESNSINNPTDVSFTESCVSVSSSCGLADNSHEKSWFSQYSGDETQPQLVTVIIGHRPPRIAPVRQPPVRRTIRRENKCLQALSMPTTTVYNMRSIWDKLNSVSVDMIERNCDISFLSEVWEKSESLKHQYRIEEMLEMQGIKYFSTPRPGAKRGGGAAIAVSPNKFTVSKLNIAIPKPLEIVWGLLRPIEPIGEIRKIILCSFYSPPNSRKNNALIDHISVTYNSLKMQHPDAGALICGDKNHLDETKILALDPNFSQIVSQNTRKDKILTIIITDLQSFFHVPKIIPPVPVDVPGKGVPSDHNGVLAVPITNANSQKKSQVTKTFVRPMPESGIQKMGEVLATADWACFTPEMSSTELVEVFENYTANLVDEIFPLKTVCISSKDKPYMTEELKMLRRQRQRIYRKSGRSPKYIEIKSKFDLKLRQAADKYHAKIEAEVREGKRNNSYSALRKLGGGGKSAGYQSFSLPSHIEDDLSPEQCANRFADYFSKISQEFQPIDVSNFQPNIQSKLKAAESESSKPVLEEWQVYGKLQHSKKPNSTVPGDLPVKLVKTLSPELAKPVTCIYNRITQSGKYPRQWVIEHQLAIPKVSPPLTEDDTRNIASTAYLSKQYESFIADWLMPYIEPFIDPGQCGGLKGSSITHYLVKLLNFVHVKLDMKQPHAVLLALIDMEKAFNRVSHQLVIEDLADMNVPGWLLLILISYLTERSMYMRYRGSSSSRRMLPGSTPQGALLGILLFIIKFNGALLRPLIPRLNSLSLKYIDDLSLLRAINLKSSLSPDPQDRPRPLAYNERTQQVLSSSDNPMQEELDNLTIFASENLMKIKEKKTNVMKFSFSRSYDFPPELYIQGFGEKLQVVQETKLLGVILTSDLKWSANTDFICKKGYKNMWTLRRMKKLNLDPLLILDVYIKEIRSVLELAVPAWHSGLTVKQTADIERVQRVAVYIILSDFATGKSEFSYDMALVVLNIEPLSVRRETLCLNFAKKTLKSRHSDMFVTKKYMYNTRQATNKYQEHSSNTQRCYKSPLNYLTRLLNENDKC